MNIAYLINYAGAGGSEKYVKIMADAAIKAGHNVTFFYNIYGPLCEYMTERGIKAYRVRMRGPFDLGAANRVAYLCKEEKIDLIHVQFPRENYVALIASTIYKSMKVVYTCHLLYQPSPLWHSLNTLMGNKDKKVIAVCDRVRSLLVKNGFSDKTVTVIHNAIEPFSGDSSFENLRGQYNIGNDEFLCVILARYTQEKGLDFLVDAFTHLKGKAKCIILGEGPGFDSIKRKIYNLGLSGTVFQAGYQKNVFDYLRSADIALNSSSSEALSFAILEGMSIGLPTVATDVGGNEELLQHFQPCGEIVPYGNEEAFANAILKLKENESLRVLYGKNAVHNIENHFNIDIMIEKTLGIYQE